jgi:hypothetical protein
MTTAFNLNPFALKLKFFGQPNSLAVARHEYGGSGGHGGLPF